MSERWKLDKYSFVDTKNGMCLNFGLKDMSRVIAQLNNYEDLLDNYEQQLAEKEKEIEKLKDYRKELEKLSELLSEHDMRNLNIMNIEKQLRKEICEEIREKSFRGCIGLNEDGTNYLHYVISPSDLDQIEKGG